MGLGKEFVEGEVTDPQFGLFLGREPVAFVVNDVTPERHQKLGRNPSDPADADQPDGLAQDGFEQFQAHPVVGVVDLVGDEGFHSFHDHPVHETLVTGGQAFEEGQDHHHGVLGNAGRPGGHDAFGPHSQGGADLRGNTGATRVDGDHSPERGEAGQLVVVEARLPKHQVVGLADGPRGKSVGKYRRSFGEGMPEGRHLGGRELLDDCYCGSAHLPARQSFHSCVNLSMAMASSSRGAR